MIGLQRHVTIANVWLVETLPNYRLVLRQCHEYGLLDRVDSVHVHAGGTLLLW